MDICADILQVARTGAKKTHIVYKANLNFKIMKRYIRNLMDNDLLEKQKGIYYTTEKGVEFLKRYKRLIATVELTRKEESYPSDISIEAKIEW